MRGLRGEAGPFEFSRRRRTAGDPDGLVWIILYRGPILLVAGVHTSPKHARVYLRRQAVVFRPRFYPIRAMLRPLDLPIKRNLHSSDQLPHVNLHFRLSASTVRDAPSYVTCVEACFRASRVSKNVSILFRGSARQQRERQSDQESVSDNFCKKNGYVQTVRIFARSLKAEPRDSSCPDKRSSRTSIH